MDANFWHQVWKDRNIAFHQSEVDEALSNNFHQLNLKPGSSVFVPLCGKTIDIAWLLQQGFKVLGAELHEGAVQELFDFLQLEPIVSREGSFLRYSGPNIDIFVGDIFDLNKELLGPVQAIYDRAALIALPELMRKQYATLLNELSDGAPQLLVIYEYDQDLMAGPPFSVSAVELTSLYGLSHTLKKLPDSKHIAKFKGDVSAHEAIWVLSN